MPFSNSILSKIRSPGCLNFVSRNPAFVTIAATPHIAASGKIYYTGFSLSMQTIPDGTGWMGQAGRFTADANH